MPVCLLSTLMNEMRTKFSPFRKTGFTPGNSGHLFQERIFNRIKKIGAWLVVCSAALTSDLSLQQIHAQTPPPPKFRDFNEVVKGMERFQGLFTLYRTNDVLYAAIRPDLFNQQILAPISIARGMASAGQPLNLFDEWILVFVKDGDKVQVVRRNIHFQAPAGTPLEKAAKQNYTDSVLMALPIISMGGEGTLIDFSQIFMTDFANLRLGMFDRNRSTWFKIKAFPNNIELQVQATYARGGGSAESTEDGIADPRGLTLVIHYSLTRLPDPGYRPRIADHRVGYFLSANIDFGSNNPMTPYVRYINRWRLEKADPRAALSAPKRQIVWWVEDTVPHEYRPFVEQGILEWNKAFEKIGFRNAIGVRWQNERDDFDPEDTGYCTFRWITTSSTFAMSGLRANPLTGEMIDGDVIFDASWIRAWKSEYAYLVGKPIANAENFEPIAMAEIISPIMASKMGYGLSGPLPGNHNPFFTQTPGGLKNEFQIIPSTWGPIQWELNQRAHGNRLVAGEYAASKYHEFNLAAMALAAEGKGSVDGKLPEEFLAQAIKEVVMHEVGHSLGLRHNFKGSTMLRYDQINDTSITRVKGMVGSIMDYNPINIAPKGQKQGDYATTTLGPYDYWAIEYAYKPIDGDESTELKKIASRSPEKDLTYGTDEDMYLNDDPYNNTYDLGSEPLKYGQDRVALAADLLKELDQNIVKDGESWARLRIAFSTLLNQYGNASYLAASYIGGHIISRDFKGEGSRDPVIPVSGDKQREALRFITEKIFSDRAFQFSPALLRRLTTELWMHWGNDSLNMMGSVDFDVFSRILAIQRISLNKCFNGAVLARIQNQELQSNPGSNPMRISEIFGTLTEGIWSEVKKAEEDQSIKISTIRRSLQREHLQKLCAIVLGGGRRSIGDSYGYVILMGGDGGSAPADARNLARLHLESIAKRIKNIIEDKMDDSTRAHLNECLIRINKVLAANYSISEG